MAASRFRALSNMPVSSSRTTAKSGILAVSRSRNFYCDTVFIPDDPSGKATGKTYAEICDDASLGVAYKMGSLSQSSLAMLQFLSFLRENPQAQLWNI